MSQCEKDGKGKTSRIHGTSLIKGNNYKDVYEKNTAWNSRISSTKASPEMVDLINKALVRDPAIRITIEQFMSHDVLSFDISDSEDFTISYNPFKTL